MNAALNKECFQLRRLTNKPLSPILTVFRNPNMKALDKFVLIDKGSSLMYKLNQDLPAGSFWFERLGCLV